VGDFGFYDLTLRVPRSGSLKLFFDSDNIVSMVPSAKQIKASKVKNPDLGVSGKKGKSGIIRKRSKGSEEEVPWDDPSIESAIQEAINLSLIVNNAPPMQSPSLDLPQTSNPPMSEDSSSAMENSQIPFAIDNALIGAGLPLETPIAPIPFIDVNALKSEESKPDVSVLSLGLLPPEFFAPAVVDPPAEFQDDASSHGDSTNL
jgi:hypothetical protein